MSPLVRLPAKQARIIGDMIERWKNNDLIDAATADRLTSSYQAAPFDWGRLAFWSILFAGLSLLTAVVSVLADKVLMDILRQFFQAPAAAKCGVFSVLAVAGYALGVRFRQKRPHNVFTNEGIFFLAVLATAGAIFYLGQAIGKQGADPSPLVLLGCGIYAAVAYALGSRLIWIFALLSLGGWLGARTGYASGWGAYYLGMNYPLRFVFFGVVLIGASAVFRLHLGAKWHALHRPTLAMGLLYLFVALWIMSIFGNYGDMAVWSKIHQYELLHWSLLFAAAGILAFLHGLRFDDAMTRGFGIVFLCINLYTRFFEYLWNSVHKALFFALLGVSLWFIGSRAQAIWNLGKTEKTAG